METAPKIENPKADSVLKERLIQLTFFAVTQALSPSRSFEEIQQSVRAKVRNMDIKQVVNLLKDKRVGLETYIALDGTYLHQFFIGAWNANGFLQEYNGIDPIHETHIGTYKKPLGN